MLDHDSRAPVLQRRSFRAAPRCLAALSWVVFFAACIEPGDAVEVRGNQPQGGAGSEQGSTGGNQPEAAGGAGGSVAPPGNTGEGGAQAVPVQGQGGASGSSPAVGSGGTGDSPPPAGAGGEPTIPANGGSGGAGPDPSTGGTGGQTTTPPIGSAPIDCSPAEGAPTGLRLTRIASGLPELTFIAAAPGDDTRLFVLERSGVVRILENGVPNPEPFLNLTPRVGTFNEEGLVGLAFHPHYTENGRLFVQYASIDASEDGEQRIILSEFTRSTDNPLRADPASERILMVVEQPSDIHLGGMLAFGPDGFLYVGRGDGGSHDSQDLESWLGKMLRIDVDTTADELPYGIPEGNMGGDGVLPEIWSRGLRNPWRFSFDACTGDLYIGDVGENTFEEIDVEPANTPGRNYGWKQVEGTACVVDPEAPDAGPRTCDSSGFTPPTLTYPRDFGCAVTGGYVYRGQRIAALRGTYLYADYCFGNFGSFRFVGGQAIDAANITADINPDNVRRITSFGVDNAGELYVLSQAGSLYRIDPD